MTDKATLDAANAAAEELLRLAITMTDATVKEAEEILHQPNPEQFRQLVRAEIGGSMAIDRLMAVYSKQAVELTDTLNIPPKDKAAHVLQMMANPLVGGLLAFVDTMQPDMRNLFLRMFTDALNTGLQLRAASRVIRERKTH